MNKIILFFLVGFSFIISLQAQISPVLPTNYGITGVRQSDADGSMILTGGTGAASLDTPSPAFLYSGFLPSSVSTTGTYTNNLTPIINGTPVTGGVQFYGPNTPYYDPWIGTGNILAVGAYKATTNSLYQSGVMYHGPLTGSVNSSNWTSITVPDSLASGTNQVGDTIPHSTMGSLVVGNFDTQGSNVTSDFGTGFIYNITNRSYSLIDFGTLATTAYGIWHNGGVNNNHYTIVGGYSTNQNGYIVNYNIDSGQFSDFTKLSFNNDSTLITHIEGINAYSNGFSLAANTAQGAAYCFIPTNNDGSFGIPSWVQITNSINSSITTGDTVISNTVMGIYPTTSPNISSYVYTVPEPSTYALFGIGAIGLLMTLRRKKTA